MALSKPKPAAPQTAGKFEDTDNTQGGTAVDDKPATVAPKVSDNAAAAAGVKASTEVARISSNSLVAGQKLETLFAAQENALPAVDFGVLPRIVGTQGQFQDKGDNKLLGDTIKVQLISWNKQFVISPGTDNDEDKEHVRYSRDGVTIDETGESVETYLQSLRETDGFKDASKKEYCELIGILLETAKPSEQVGNMVQVSLSPQSRKLFEGFRLQESVKLRLNPQSKASDVLVLRAEVKTQGSFTFTVIKASAVK
jgi:hypothetical protein